MNFRCLLAFTVLAAAPLTGGTAQAADVAVHLQGAGGAPGKVEKLPGDDRYNLSLVVGTFSWPPADCADVCVTFESFEKSAGRRGTIMRLYSKQAGLRRDREVDFLPAVNADEVRAHTDTILIIVHSIMHEVSIPAAEIPLPKIAPPVEEPLKPGAQPPKRAKEKPETAVEKRVLPEHAFVLPIAVAVGADWLGNSMLAPTVGFDVAARFPYRIVLALDYRYRFPAGFYVGDLRVSAGGQRYSLGIGVALPRFRSLDTFLMFVPAIESVELEAGGERRFANIGLYGAEARLYYRPQQSYGMFVLAGAAYAETDISVQNGGDGTSWDVSHFAAGVHAGMFYEIDLFPR